MSPLVRAGLIFGVASVAAFVASFFIRIPFINFMLAYGSVLALGWGAGYTAAKASGSLQGQGAGRGAAAGALAGVVHLILFTLALTLLVSLVSRIPGVQNAFQNAISQAQSRNPNANLRNVPSAGTILGVGGAFVGFCFGLVNLLLMTIAGLVGGAMWKGAAYPAGMPTGQYMPATGYTVGNQPPYGNQPPAAGLPTPGTNFPPNQPDEAGARVYPERDQR